MIKYPKPKTASRGKAPPQNPLAHPEMLGLPFVEVRDIVVDPKMIAGKEKTRTFFYAEYDPPMKILRAQFGPTCRRDGWEERCFSYDTRNDNPRFLVVWCRRVRFEADGKVHYDLARPAGFNNGRRCHDDLEDAVRGLLVESSVAQIRRATALSRPRIKAICGEMVEAYPEELRAPTARRSLSPSMWWTPVAARVRRAASARAHPCSWSPPATRAVVRTSISGSSRCRPAAPDGPRRPRSCAP